jgi:DNA-binding transcriptional MerR regulator/effector-binding domain-containing protein
MLRISDMARLAQVSIRTLRYYDEVGLLKPSRIDKWTSYRYYSLDQLPRLNRIIALKDLGFSLDQIGQLINSDKEVSLEQLRGMLKLKQAEVEQRLTEEQERLGRIKFRLGQIEKEGQMREYDVVIKRVEAQTVASIRGVVPDVSQLLKWSFEMGDLIKESGVQANGPWLHLYHQSGYQEEGLDVEEALFIDPASANRRKPGHDPRLKVYELPAVETMVSVTHQGDWDNLNDAYATIDRWLQSNGYKPTGPCREIYLREEGDPADFLTEIQFPAAKVDATGTS